MSRRKKYSVPCTFHLDKRLRAGLSTLAERSRRTISAELEMILCRALEDAGIEVLSPESDTFALPSSISRDDVLLLEEEVRNLAQELPPQIS